MRQISSTTKRSSFVIPVARSRPEAWGAMICKAKHRLPDRTYHCTCKRRLAFRTTSRPFLARPFVVVTPRPIPAKHSGRLDRRSRRLADTSDIIRWPIRPPHLRIDLESSLTRPKLYSSRDAAVIIWPWMCLEIRGHSYPGVLQRGGGVVQCGG
jgi:hypothetical protein